MRTQAIAILSARTAPAALSPDRPRSARPAPTSAPLVDPVPSRAGNGHPRAHPTRKIDAP